MTDSKIQLQAVSRALLGRGVAALRRVEKIPANIYSKRKDSLAITLDKKEFLKLYSSAGETTLIELSIEGEKSKRPVLIRDAQKHPVSGAIIHVDFQQVDLTVKVTANIPVETFGESEAVKSGGVLVLTHNEIEVEALPTDLPEGFKIDVSKLLAVGDTVTVADLEYDHTKVSLALEADEILVTIQAPAVEQVVEVTEPVEVELTKQGATKSDEESPALTAPTKEA